MLTSRASPSSVRRAIRAPHSQSNRTTGPSPPALQLATAALCEGRMQLGQRLRGGRGVRIRITRRPRSTTFARTVTPRGSPVTPSLVAQKADDHLAPSFARLGFRHTIAAP